MEKRPLIGVSLCVVVFLVLGSSVPVIARTQSSLAKTMPSISPSSAANYEVYIGAGIIRQYEQKFGLGWHMTVMNTGDTNITGSTSSKEITLFGKIVDNWSQPFSLGPGIGTSIGSAVLDFHPITLITLTVVVENISYSKYGYGIGPFVLLPG
ncbi:MAG: hypothetical protein WC525_06375 [Candidatus Thermoplasmatota archaeon]